MGLADLLRNKKEAPPTGANPTVADSIAAAKAAGPALGQAAMKKSKRQAKRAAEAAAEDGTPKPTEAQRIFLRFFGGLAHRRISKHPQLSIKLQRARNPLVPVAYLASVYGHVSITALIAGLPLLGYFLFTLGFTSADPRLAAALVVLPILSGLVVFSYELLKPDLEIGARKRGLDGNLPYALNFMAAMASAGVVPAEIFGALGQQHVYGEVAREAQWIHRDTKVFSKDLVSALKTAARRSPSQQFEEFLQGSVNTITSGGDLKTYFLAKSEQFSSENRRKQKQFLESMGVMAESYVVVAAAAPLFLIVILSVMTLLSAGADPILFLNILILLALPILHGMFIWILRTMRAD